MNTFALLSSTTLTPAKTRAGTIFTGLTIRNFLSIGAVTMALNLDLHGLTLVLGANADTNGGMTRNGAGKTTILQAISYVLYGKSLSKIKIPNLVNNINNKQMLVTIDFERNGTKYRIERGKKPDVLKFFINDQQIKDDEDEGSQLGENRHTLAEIERAVGMSHTMFKHIVALNTYTDPFLRMPVAQQREVIEELLGVTQISQRAETLKKLLFQTKEEMREEQARIKAVIEANTRIENAIANTETQRAQWDKQHNRFLFDFRSEIAVLEGIDYDEEIVKFDLIDAWQTNELEARHGLEGAKREVDVLARELKAIEADMLRFQREANTDITTQVNRLTSELARKERDVASLTKSIEDRRVEIAKLESDVARSGKLECFCCGQELEGTDHLHTVLDKMHKNIKKLNDATSADEASIAALRGDAESVLGEIEHIKTTAETNRIELTVKSEAKALQAVEKRALLDEHTVALTKMEEALRKLGSRPESMFFSRDDLYKAKQEFDRLIRELQVESEKVNPHIAQIETFKSTLQEVNYDKLNELDSESKHQDFLLRLLTNKDSFIRKKIIDQNLNELNRRMNYYLEKLGLPHEVKFCSDLSVEILLLGRDLDFEQLSRGEMNRVIMATSWSFRDVWERLNESFNLMFVDEMLDQGIDGHGAEAALGVLKSMVRDRGKNIFLISHRDDLTARIDRILLVKKQNGFTQFEEDALH